MSLNNKRYMTNNNTISINYSDEKLRILVEKSEGVFLSGTLLLHFILGDGGWQGDSRGEYPL